MKVTVFRTGLLLSSLFTTALIGALYVLAPILGAAYLETIKNIGDQLPNLTLNFALPLLGAAPPGGLERSVEMPWWAGGVWLLTFVCPWLTTYWAWQADSVETGTIRWMVGMSLYLPICGVILAAVLAGLIIALAPM